MNELQVISLVISVSSFLIPLAIGIKKWRTLIWLYVFTGFTFDIGLVVLKWKTSYSLFPFANVYVLLEYLLFSLYYYRLIGKHYKYFLQLVVILASAYIVQTLVNGIEHRNGIGAASFYAIYLLYALLGFYIISKKREYQLITSSSFFWVNVAVLLGSSGRVVLFLFEDYLSVHQMGHLAKLWIIYKMFNVLINVLFAVALSRKYE